MEYRINQRTGDKISVIGIGSSYLSETPEKEALETLEMAYENGINYIDLAAGAAGCFSYYGKAFEAHRKDMIYQIHFGADYASGEYGWTTNVEQIKRSIDWQLTKLRTDYIDYGFIHCLDKESDWDAYRKNGDLDHHVSVDESILDAEGTVDLSKWCPITFDPVHNTYTALGEAVGNAFSDGKKLC